MTDIGLTVVLTREALSLPDLQLNDYLSYYTGADSLAQLPQTWNRQQVSSSFCDGAVTVSRTRAQLMIPLAVEVLGDTPAELKANMAALKQALSQDSFNLAWAIGEAAYQYQGEAADYTEVYSPARLAAHQAQLQCSVPCLPLELIGAG